MIIFLWSLLLTIISVGCLWRSFYIANAEYCPQWNNFFDASINGLLTKWQRLNIGVLVLFNIMVASWNEYFLGGQLFFYVATSLAVFWAMLVLLDGLTWWLPHMFTHSLWVIILLLSGFGVGLPFLEAALSGLLGYLGLWGLNQFSIWYWHKPGFGGGDLYLSGALASWFGWFQLGNVWLLAALFSLALVAVIKLFSKEWRSYVPFGPGLGMAAVSLLMFNVYQSASYAN